MPPSPLPHATEALAFVDDDGVEVVLDAEEAEALLALTDGLEGATVSACPRCGSRVLAVVALAELLAKAPPHPRAGALVELAEEAPTLHLYVVDLQRSCRHERWLDPGFDEWADAVGARVAHGGRGSR